jgi:hypothetical protein
MAAQNVLAAGNANFIRSNMEKSPVQLSKEALLLPIRGAAFLLDHLQIKGWSELPADPTKPANITIFEDGQEAA